MDKNVLEVFRETDGNNLRLLNMDMEEMCGNHQLYLPTIFCPSRRVSAIAFEIVPQVEGVREGCS